MSMKPWYPAPTSSKILLYHRSPQLLLFEMSCAVRCQTAGTTNILLLLPEQGRSKQLLSQIREEKEQEGQPTWPLFQVPAGLLCCCNLCQVRFRNPKFDDFKVFASLASLSPASFPSAGSGWIQCRVPSWEIHFQSAAEHALPHWNCKSEACCSQVSQDFNSGSLRGLWEPAHSLLQLLGATETRALWPLSWTSWPRLRQRMAPNCRCAGGTATQTVPSASSSLSPLLYLSQTWPLHISHEQFLLGSGITCSYLHPGLVS